MSIRKSITAIVVTIASAVALAPAGAEAERKSTTRPVHGKATGIVSINVKSLEISGVVKGRVFPLGKMLGYLRTREIKVTPAGTSGTGTFTWLAATGDKVTGTFTLAGAPPTSNVHMSELKMTITGGTGRFAGATGMISVTNTLTPFESPTEESPFILETVRSVARGHISY